jgi:solute carrier family 6 (neurotransmitter transporter)
MRSYEFLIKKPPDFPPNMQVLPPYMNQHTNFLMGVRIMKPEGFPVIDNNNLMINTNSISGYQALRVATELYPATLAVLGSTGLSPFWTVLFYFTCIMFGIAQQLAIWHCIIKGVTAINVKMLKSWETTITFFVCALGFGLGLPLCTEVKIDKLLYQHQQAQ